MRRLLTILLCITFPIWIIPALMFILPFAILIIAIGQMYEWCEDIVNFICPK